jgi:hypothetical protein
LAHLARRTNAGATPRASIADPDADEDAADDNDNDNDGGDDE